MSFSVFAFKGCWGLRGVGVEMKITCIEDLESWQLARRLVKMIYRVTNEKPFNRDFVLRDHIRKSAISVISNIAEGFDTISNVEFCRFLNFAIRSLTELQSQLYVALDVGHLDTVEFKEIFNLSTKCRQTCKGMSKYLRQKLKRQHPCTPKTP